MNFLYRCPNCNKNSLAEDWNKSNKMKIAMFDSLPIPQAIKVHGIYLDCPKCNEKIYCKDIITIK